MKDNLVFGYDTRIEQKVEFLFIARNSDNVLYSYDGITWHIDSAMPMIGHWTAVASNGSRFVALMNYDELSNVAYMAAYSDDGKNWTRFEMPDWAVWHSISSNGLRFVAIGRDISSGANQKGDVAAYSDDGINWVRTVLPEYTQWQSVTSQGVGKGFVAIARSLNLTPNNISAYSADGSIWTRVNLPGNYDRYDVTGNSTGFFMGSYNDGNYPLARPSDKGYFSPDGINWQEVNMPDKAIWISVTNNGSRFVALSWGVTSVGEYYSPKVAYSDNGIDWAGAANVTGGGVSVSAANNNMFITTDANTDGLYYSRDGIDWTRVTLPYTMNWSCMTSRQIV